MRPSIFWAPTLVELFWPRQSRRSRFSRLQQSFFSRQALAEDFGLLEWEVDNFGARTLGSFSRESFIDWPWFLAAVELADQKPQEQCWSMSLVVARDRRFALALATTAFFTIWTKLSNLWSSFCSLAKIDGRKPSWKYLSIVGLVRAPTGLYANKINCKCSRCAAYSNIDFCWCWKTCLNWILKFFPHHWILGLGATFLLLPSLDHRLAEKWSGKWDPIWAIDPGSFKMVLTLLAELIAI